MLPLLILTFAIGAGAGGIVGAYWAALHIQPHIDLLQDRIRMMEGRLC